LKTSYQISCNAYLNVLENFYLTFEIIEKKKVGEKNKIMEDKEEEKVSLTISNF
jgi:hypothetical protein